MLGGYVDKITRERQIFNYLTARKRGRRTGRICPIWREKHKPADNVAYADCMHHRTADKKTNRKLYPLFIDSMLNQLPVNNGWHLQWGSFRTINFLRAAKYESFLMRHPTLAAWANGRISSMRGEFGKWSVRDRKDGRPYLIREGK